MSKFQRPAHTPSNDIRAMCNVGAGLDIPNGTYHVGKHGEHILNGGLSQAVAIMAIGNQFKSTLLFFMVMQAMARMASEYLGIYDTECNLHKPRISMLSERIEYWWRDMVDTVIFITDKSKQYADVWFSELKKALRLKKDDKAQLIETPFVNRDGSYFKIQRPTADVIDSFSEFETQDVVEIAEENDIGASEQNRKFMRQGIAKTQFLQEMPAILASSNHYLLLTLQQGREIAMDARTPPAKKVHDLKNGDKAKGATDKMSYLTTDWYQIYNLTRLINKDGGPEYPHEKKVEKDTDLNSIMVRNLRSKSGKSGMVIEIISSQTEGVLPSLTEYHNLKTYDYYGLAGNNRTHALYIYPEVNLSRTSARDKIDEDPKLRRALNITMEMMQMYVCWNYVKDNVLTAPEEVYKAIIEKGYDWDMILTHTRGWWAPVGERMDKVPLSTMDILRMAKGLYHPYWLEEDKKTIKPEYAKHLGKLDI